MIAAHFGSTLNDVLVLGAHCDDVELGCFGTLAGIVGRESITRLRVVLFAADDVRESEAREAWGALAAQVSRPRLELTVHRFRDGFFPAQWADIKDRFEAIKREGSPDLVFTHAGCDAHQDHRVISELTWNTFRGSMILEYEIPKYDGDLGRPTVYVPLDGALVDRKIETLLRAYRSQSGKAWFTADLFRGLMRLRGMECASPSGFAEAFYCRKLVLNFDGPQGALPAKSQRRDES